MKRIVLLCSACLIGWTLSAQVKLTSPQKDRTFRYRNSVQLELGGHGLIYSINYERNILNFDHFKTSLQLGASFYPAPIDLRARLWIPFSVNQLLSLGRHHLEAGAGLLLTRYQNYTLLEGELRHDNKSELHLTGKIGYRYQKPGGRMVYKALFTPILLQEYGVYELTPLAGISIGYNF